MSKIELYNKNNMEIDFPKESFDYIYSDYMYENKNFEHAAKYWEYLKPNSVMALQTDWHSVFELGVFMKTLKNSFFISHSVIKCVWGKSPSRTYHQCFDDILIFANSPNYRFYPERIQVDKITKNKGLNPFGRLTKKATAWIDDCTLTTTSKQRVKKPDGHLVEYQKDLRLFDRITSCFTDEGDNICENFGGVFTLGVWSAMNNRNCICIEMDSFKYGLGRDRLSGLDIKFEEIDRVDVDGNNNSKGENK